MIKEYLGNVFKKLIVKKVKDKLDNLIEEDKENEVDDKKMDYIYDPTLIPTRDIIETIDFSTIQQPIILNDDLNKPTVIVIDDVACTDIMYKQDIKKMSEIYHVDPYKDFRLIKCIGEQAGLQAYKYAVIENNKIDYGIIDITLGHQLRVMDGYYMEMDGIDVAYYLKQVNPNFNFLLCTAHTLNRNNSVITKYDNKMIKNFNTKLETYYLNKNSYRVDKFYQLVYGNKCIDNCSE